MLSGLLLALREGLEAALIIGIVIGVVEKLNREALKRPVWWAVATAGALSLAIGAGLYALNLRFEGTAEEIYEGFAMIFAAGVLTWMILWMQRQGGRIREDLEDRTRAAARGNGAWPLFLLAFLAVFREGLELALFLLATSMVAGLNATLIGAVLGLASAIAAGYVLLRGTRGLSLRTFFRVTSLLLILFAAGLVSTGVHEFNEVGWIPPIIEHIWDVNPILDENSTAGQLLKALFGYNGNPSLTEVIAYLAYFGVLMLNFLSHQRRELNPQPANLPSAR